MADKTKIQWCDSTVNPTMGCDGCELWSGEIKKCYAGKMHGDKGATNPGFSSAFNNLTQHRGRMAKAAEWPSLRGQTRFDSPWKNGMPRMIFVSDMSDALSKDISFEYLLTEIIDLVGSAKGRQHVWQWLTKRPPRMAEFDRWLEDMGVPWPENLWAGTSLTTNVSRSRIGSLTKVRAKVRFLSVEPQHEDIDLAGRLDGIHWVIQGGESGVGAEAFDIEWADKMRRQCEQAEVAYFMKQLGANVKDYGVPIRLRDRHGGDWSEWDERLKVRDFPAIQL